MFFSWINAYVPHFMRATPTTCYPVISDMGKIVMMSGHVHVQLQQCHAVDAGMLAPDIADCSSFS
jgi:hypothetical protein